MRLFIPINFPPELREALHRAVSSAEGVSTSSVMYGYTVSGIGVLGEHVTFVDPAAAAGTSMLIFHIAVTASESLGSTLGPQGSGRIVRHSSRSR